MNELLNLLKDGRSRTIEMLAVELNTSTEDVLRRIEFLERSGIIRRVATSYSENETLATAGRKNPCSTCLHGCSGSGCGKSVCSSCMPEGGFKNMGSMWEIVK